MALEPDWAGGASLSDSFAEGSSTADLSGGTEETASGADGFVSSLPGASSAFGSEPFPISALRLAITLNSIGNQYLLDFAIQPPERAYRQG